MEKLEPADVLSFIEDKRFTRSYICTKRRVGEYIRACMYVDIGRLKDKWVGRSLA